MEHFYKSRAEAASAAAVRISQALHKRLEQQAEASLVVSGGTSPERCLEELSTANLDWQRVHVLLSDERWVAADDDSSNQKFIERTLLQGPAAAATLHGVYQAGIDIAERCDDLDEAIRQLPFPFACSLIGMGEDGHFASLFPDAENLKAGLDVDYPGLCLPVSTAASPHPRVSLTLAAISRSDEVVLLFFGAAKRDIYEQAKLKSNGYPVAWLLLQKRAPVHVFWAP
ncbi:MAG: 6-phosphogluconolactonase [Gammaproteobacteria bacterium]|nr:6-phosphogluconolactonase [Gammaproteobacteria bacterium]MDH3429211.1 6-phosphogluconolactonase [Gammaproteobacteria bacterium]MDH3433919.1 6-phosphogluconolactonase [Gammaproteobacteria bacterium]